MFGKHPSVLNKSTLNYQLSVSSYQLSVSSYQLSVSSYQLLKARGTLARGKRQNLTIFLPKKKVRD
ncbi:MAG: hypothetical protein EWV91_20025 [Microcystis aeruginosa Ma_QC_Ca_00000000_S207]|uniref:Uncharacterized protein n=1 Tax=Microcystis aeruginosa Ma_QC_Ca_00000000_S207 TaxID=2486251 RepID=A0A552F6W5_MICAE|nr:MAG: hypothetical protein EWV91_20025 [Microcystis aeruginosa Ma_QC_Ca_00000000_S207]